MAQGFEVDWDKVKVFKLTCELGSMNAAAGRLGETTATVSRKIDELERVLNAQLLTRSTRGVEPTPAGRAALRYAKSMQDAADAIYIEVSNQNDPLTGPVTLATRDGVGPYWIANRLPQFHLAHPQIHLNLQVIGGVADVLSGDVDIAIQFSEPRQHDVIARRLGVLHYMFFATQGYIETFGEPGSLFELYNHRCLFHEGYVEQIENWAPKSADLKRLIDMALVTNSATVLHNVCANGGGIALLPSYASQLDTRLVALNLPEVAPITFWITYSERLRRLARGRATIEWVRSCFDTETVPWFRDRFVHPNHLQESGASTPVPAKKLKRAT
jgi:DNA-binding transcriptional LysR family regulator